jgi:NitT/TauT family transport system permease protein
MSTITKEPQPTVVYPARRGSWLNMYLKPQEAIPREIYLAAMLITVALLLALWAALTYGGLVSALFLPSPTAVVDALIKMIANGSLWGHIQASLLVILVGWALAVLVAVPVGIVMGSFRLFEAVLEPLVNFVRYLPVSALIPLLILYIGIDVRERIAVIFIGTFFQLVLLVADVAAHVPHDLLDSAYTLGAKRYHALTHVLIPATLPGVMDNLRITIGWAWTYLVVAELVAAEQGLGYMILDSMRGLFVARIFVGLLTIGLLGFATDQIFKLLHRKLLPWSPRIS